MATQPSRPAPPPPPSCVGPESEAEPIGTGTGFFVNARDVVTAYHVIKGCGCLQLADGTRLTVTGRHQQHDLAVLESSRTSVVELPISREARPALGEDVYALGYPFLRAADPPDLSMTGGNMSKRTGFFGERNLITFTAPIQPGNSGGPLIDTEGHVVGVVVSQLNAQAFLENSGDIPQNMNFAVPTDVLVDFLGNNGTEFERRTQSGFDVSDGLPREVEKAVVPVFCY